METSVINIDEDKEGTTEPVVKDVVENEEQEKKNGGRQRSWVWDHFTLEKGNKKARCLYYKKQSTLSFKPHSSKEGGSSLASHMFSREKSLLSFVQKTIDPIVWLKTRDFENLYGS
ncbi:hypothetical protein E3N88_09911 [Mikania micrantha]|uniref:BED-type domain-containing protein n=1 Tax=Mikania micrantha TaxID=192012 RepID=A0A5N6P952_9ASTR|nr:hypothetical protein E3N88_09911 [Mikania micrantha]